MTTKNTVLYKITKKQKKYQKDNKKYTTLDEKNINISEVSQKINWKKRRKNMQKNTNKNTNFWKTKGKNQAKKHHLLKSSKKHPNEITKYAFLSKKTLNEETPIIGNGVKNTQNYLADYHCPIREC